MAAHAITAEGPATQTTAKADKADVKPGNSGMMAGADMYRRMQAKPKGSSISGYLIGGVAAVAIIAGGAYFATHQTHAGANQAARMAATTAAAAAQQAQASQSEAQSEAQAAQQAAQADAAKAKAVADTGNPPAVVHSAPVKTSARAEHRHEAPVVRRVVARQQARPASAAVAAGIDASALTPPPPAVTATQPPPSAPVQAAPAVSAPAAATPAPAPAPQATPAPTLQQTPVQTPSTTTPPQ